LIAGDIDGDGSLDLAILGFDTISIYLGNGDGTFNLKSSTFTGDYPYGFTAGDFNNDGILDFAVSNNYTNTVQILLGIGDGTFSTGASYATGNSPEDLVATDFNRDGNTDLAIVNQMDKTVAVLLGNGNGRFVAGPTVVVPASPYTLVAGDFNGDGIPDLAISAIIQGAEIYLGNGDGSFTAKSTISCGTIGNGYGMATADLNHDGKTDLIVGGALFTGDGTGTFTLLSYVGGNGSPVSIGDFNGDGSPDLITPVYSSSYPFNGNVKISLEQSSVTMMVAPIKIQGPGSHNVVASYSGDGAHAASQSNSVALTGAQITSTASVRTFPGTSVPSGSVLQLVASISPGQIGNYTPTGTVTFKDESTILGIEAVSSGQASLSTNSLTVGSHTLSASYGGDANFAASVSSALVITVTTASKTTPTITWPTPAPITYGTALSLTQLDATSGGVAGTFAYAPAAGMVLDAGAQMLSVTFTPTDTNSYNSVNATVTLTVNKATPALNWPTPAAITYGTPLSATQLNATVGGVAGTFVYTPAAGTVLGAGSQNLSVTFIPTDATNYGTASTSVTQTVNKAVLTVAATNASRTYGAANPSFAPNYNGFVKGETPSVLSGAPSLTTTATATSPVGAYTITMVVGNLSAANYSFSFVNGSLIVSGAALTITANNQSKTYGQALTLSTTAFVAGGVLNSDSVTGVTLTSGGAAASAAVGSHPIVPSAAVGTGLSNYTITYTNGTLTVNPAAATHLAVSAIPAATAGTAFNFTVTALDASNSKVSGYSGIVHFSSTDGAATLPVDSTLASGTGTFSATLKSAGAETITAADTVTGSIAGISNNVAVSAATATRLFFSRQPGGGTAGTAWASQPIVIVQDAYTNAVAGSSASIALVIASNPSGGTLSCGVNPLNASSGIATFSGCAINKSGTGYTLTAGSAGLSAVTSTPFNIAVGAAAKLAFTSTPAGCNHSTGTCTTQ
jgi:hypothetical protein